MSLSNIIFHVNYRKWYLQRQWKVLTNFNKFNNKQFTVLIICSAAFKNEKNKSVFTYELYSDHKLKNNIFMALIHKFDNI